jgi:hypothetical protein
MKVKISTRATLTVSDWILRRDMTFAVFMLDSWKPSLVRDMTFAVFMLDSWKPSLVLIGIKCWED